jgi:hypothetical protein
MSDFIGIISIKNDKCYVNLQKIHETLNIIKSTKNYDFSKIYNSKLFTDLNILLKFDDLTCIPIHSTVTCFLNTPDKSNTTLLIHALKNKSGIATKIINMYEQHCNIEHIDNNGLTSFDYASIHKMYDSFDKLMIIYFKIQLLECDEYEFDKSYTLNNVLSVLLNQNKIELMEKTLNLLIKYKCDDNPYFDNEILNCGTTLFYICEKNLADIALLILNNEFAHIPNIVCNKKCILISSCKNKMSLVAIKILEMIYECEFYDDCDSWNTTLLNVLIISHKNKMYDVIEKIIELFDCTNDDNISPKIKDDDTDDDTDDDSDDGDELNIVIVEDKTDSDNDSDYCESDEEQPITKGYFKKKIVEDEIDLDDDN